MKRIALTAILLLISSIGLFAQTFSLNGTILEKKSGKAVEFATVVLEKTEQWAIADANGKFTIKNIQAGKNTLTVSCLGYVSNSIEIIVTKDIPSFKAYLQEDNLALESVVVTAQQNENSATTSRIMDKTALEHIQMLNVADVSSLLPGGRTSNAALTTEQRFLIRSNSTEQGNPSFGTAVEIDGVRISGNASYADANSTSSSFKGVTTNNIGSANVESIEVISGVPSVEYGDMTSGVVKVNTKKGKTPLIVTMSTNQRSKQLSVSKGFGLGNSRKGRSNGIVNASAEYTRSISSLMSPFTAYDRKQLSLNYSNTFASGIFSESPVRFSMGVTGNLGGMDSMADPDSFKDTFSKTKDNALRANLQLNWLLSKSWITNIELNASASYTDRLSRTRTNYSAAASSDVAIHGREEGYFVAQDYEVNPDAEILLKPRGYWYNTMGIDDKPFNSKLGIKANWARQFGKLNNKVKLGADWTSDRNFGIGEFTEDLATAPTFREYRYCDVPVMQNVAAYLEDNISIPMGKTRLNVVAGIRNDNSIINGSVYGNTSSWSPRLNAKYVIFSPRDRHGKTVKDLSFKASWGVAVKQPSYSVLYPVPSYKDIQTFVSTSSSDGTAYLAYMIMPRSLLYNENLRWQKSRQSEVGMDINIGGYKISLTGFYSRTIDAYRISSDYAPFSYNYTYGSVLQTECSIPVDNRRYEVDRNTGAVTVYDKTGVLNPETMSYATRNMLDNSRFASNSLSPSTRYGLEWVVDFKKINAINTTIRLDGTFYGYRYVDSNLESYCQTSLMSTDGTHYKYVGIYYGGNQLSNGSEKRSVSTNMTITTHIPKIRMVLSLKTEVGAYTYNRNLGERADGGVRNLVISDKNDILSITDDNLYDGDHFSVCLPDMYRVVIENPDGSLGLSEPRDYLADLKAARESDPKLYSDLSKLAVSTSYSYMFKEETLSPYFCMNFSVTKEIGDFASISLYANNFFNNYGQVYSSKTGFMTSVSSYIPSFFYGLSLRLKF